MEFNILIGWRRIVAFGSLDEATLFRLAEDTTWLDGQTWRKRVARETERGWWKSGGEMEREKRARGREPRLGLGEIAFDRVSLLACREKESL